MSHSEHKASSAIPSHTDHLSPFAHTHAKGTLQLSNFVHRQKNVGGHIETPDCVRNALLLFREVGAKEFSRVRFRIICHYTEEMRGAAGHMLSWKFLVLRIFQPKVSPKKIAIEVSSK